MQTHAQLLTTKLNDAAALVLPLLNGEADEEQYVTALHALLTALKECSPEDIRETDAEPEIRNSLGADKSIMIKAVTKETDQISLISTLVVYTECHREGMPNHSRLYMDRVTEVRKHIEHYYKEEIQKFCGS